MKPAIRAFVLKPCPQLAMPLQVNGPILEPHDYGRIGKQRLAVFNLMRDAKWRTLGEIAELTGYPEASVSARLRDFRKLKYGDHTVDRARLSGRGTWHYKLVVNP